MFALMIEWRHGYWLRWVVLCDGLDLDSSAGVLKRFLECSCQAIFSTSLSNPDLLLMKSIGRVCVISVEEALLFLLCLLMDEQNL